MPEAIYVLVSKVGFDARTCKSINTHWIQKILPQFFRQLVQFAVIAIVASDRSFSFWPHLERQPANAETRIDA